MSLKWGRVLFILAKNDVAVTMQFGTCYLAHFSHHFQGRMKQKRLTKIIPNQDNEAFCRFNL